MDRDRIGKYQIVGELGRGTMGEVYKARDPVLNRFVAIKTLPARLGPDDETLLRFKREAQAAALLNHPNIVTIHDFGEEQGLIFIAMELLEGIDLREAIDASLLTTLDEKLAVMDSVLAALDYAHAKGVIHRDIKPANIHLGKSRQVTPSHRIRVSANQKVGIAWPITASVSAKRSARLLGHTAASTPSGMASTSAKAMAEAPRAMVTGSRSKITSATGWRRV